MGSLCDAQGKGHICLQAEHGEPCGEGKQASLLLLLRKWLFSVSKCVTGN